MHVLIAGGRGMIGTVLSKRFIELGHQVSILTRDVNLARSGNPELIAWDGKYQCGWSEAINRVDGIINLAGESIGSGRWTGARKKRIVQSRVDAGQALSAAILAAKKKPGFFIQVSAIGAYGTDETKGFDETDPYGTDFLAKTCQAWEASTLAVKELGVRHITARIGVVLDKKQGALPRMALPIRLGAGGPMGSGQQWVSWVSLDDVAAAMVFLADRNQYEGIYNITSPNPVSNRDFGKAIAGVLHRSFWLPLPAFALQLLLGEMSVLVLEGQKVLPKRLMGSGFAFHYPELEPVLEKVLSGM